MAVKTLEEKAEEAARRMLEPVLEQIEQLRSEDRRDEALDKAVATIVGLGKQLAIPAYLAAAKRLLRSSEKIDPRQLELLADQLAEEEVYDSGDDDEDEVTDPEVEDLVEVGEEKQPPRRRGRKPLPEHLPREHRCLDVSEKDCTCPACGADRVEIGRDVREVLDIAPIRFRVLRYERIRRACPSCQESGVVIAPAPDDQLERVLASPRLLAHVTACKYEAHVPLHRLQRLYRHMGVKLAESTLGGWIARVAEELAPLDRALWTELRSQPIIGTDASGLRVLDRDAPDNVTLGTMWCYVGYPGGTGKRLCAYRYARTGAGADGPWKHLQGQTGYVQADAANVFDRLFNGKVANAIEVGCWAHARRKLHELLESDPRVAKPLQRIAAVYRIEKAARLNDMGPETRLDLRRRKATRHVEWLQKWLKKTSGREPPQSGMGKACRYWLNHWDALTCFLEDGRIELDNTEVERQIRALALGRKNYLFAGSHAAAERSATIYSLLRSCDLADIDATDWMEDVLVRLAGGWPQSRIGELLPHRWQPG